MNAMNSPLCANYNSCTRVSPLCIPRMKYICIYSATTTRKNEKYFKKNKPNKLSFIKTNTKPAHNHESLAAAVSLRSKRSSRNEQMRSGLLKPEPEIIRANDILCKTEYVRLVRKKHIIRTCLMHHAACKVELQPFKRLYSQLTFFNSYKIMITIECLRKYVFKILLLHKLSRRQYLRYI